METGDYVGYTLGGQEPTLYFTGGRLTQQHRHAKNVGWHPLKTGRRIIRNNIVKIEYEAYKYAKAIEVEQNLGFGFCRMQLGFVNKMIRGTYKEVAHAETLLEIQVEQDVLKSFHPSRGRLIRRKDPQCVYRNTYARMQIKKAKVAEKDGETDEKISYAPSKY